MKDIVDVYPVGLLADLKRLRVNWWVLRRRDALCRFVKSVSRGWRRGSYYNGYLAEPNEEYLGAWLRCGHGWTKQRARLDLARHLDYLKRGVIK